MTPSPSGRAEWFETCAGLASRAFVVTPDTTFNPDGMFKISLVSDLSEPGAKTFKDWADAAAKAGLRDLVPERSQSDWNPLLPYEWEQDAESGERTGRVIYHFKRNGRVRLRRNGETRDLTVAVFDSKNRQAWPPPPIANGSLIKVWAKFQPIKIDAMRAAGVYLEFSSVKVLRMASISPFAHDEIEDGWTC